MAKKERTPMKPTVKKGLLQAGGFLTSIAPIAVLFGVRWDVYTATPASTVSLAFGGAICLVLTLLKLLGKMPKNVKPVIWYGVAFAIVFLLDALVEDLKWIVGMAFLGEFADWAIFSHAITKAQREIDSSAMTSALDKGVEKLVEAINNSKGRV